MKKRVWTMLAGIILAVVAIVALVPAVLAGPTAHQVGMMSQAVAMGAMPQMQAMQPMQGMGRMMADQQGGAFSLPAIAAEVMGMELADLLAELQAGKSIADVAAERGANVNAIIEAFVASRAERLDAAVAAGRLTREEADARLATMRANVTARINTPGRQMMRGGRGPGNGNPNPTPGTCRNDQDGDGVCDGPGAGGGPGGCDGTGRGPGAGGRGGNRP